MKQHYINYSNRAMLGGVGGEAIMDPEGGCKVSLSRWHALKKKNNGCWLFVRKGRESREETCFCFGLFTLTKYRLKGNHDDFGHVSSTKPILFTYQYHLYQAHVNAIIMSCILLSQIRSGINATQLINLLSLSLSAPSLVIWIIKSINIYCLEVFICLAFRNLKVQRCAPSLVIWNSFLTRFITLLCSACNFCYS